MKIDGSAIRMAAGLWVVIAGVASPALCQHSIRCGGATLLGASGYPGWDRSYELRGHCNVYAHTAQDAWGFGGPHIGPIPTTLNEGVEQNEDKVADFEALAKVSWNGKTGQVHESMTIDGTKLSTSVNCAPADPFINGGPNTTCQDAQASGDVNMKILTAIIQSRRPVFARTVDESRAQMLSWQSDKGAPPPPPPPAPAVKVPVAKKPAAGPSGAAQPVVPKPASGHKESGGSAKSSGGTLLVVSPEAGGTPAPDRLGLPVAPTPLGGRATAPNAAAPPPAGFRVATSPTPAGRTSAGGSRTVASPTPTATPSTRRGP